MSAIASTFYVTGGTLRQDAACYVERQADKDLLDGLIEGEFCYVLTSRQMGKSSLMVRTAGKLREQGVQVVVLDLTAIGQNLTPEQWYDGLLVRLGRQLDLEDELEKFWETHRQLGPCQRLFAALRDVVLGSAPVSGVVVGVPPNTSGSGQSATTDPPRELRIPPGETPGGATGTVALPKRLVLFVDEIDVVRSLPFSTDEFFAAIRECYNRRTEDAEFNRLTFCLLGVATPSDLIRDTRTTPFNIGQRIVLNDFTPEEAAPLAEGLQRGKGEREKGSQAATAALARVLHWTNGHPYLTQRLCQAVAERSSRREETPSTTGSVDELCEELFFSNRAREQDDNLLFVRERLLRSEVDLPALLHLYEQLQRGKAVPDDETNPLVSVLRLSGIVRSQDGQLVERNRVYERVFDRAWLHANMPDAEVRRQRAAFLRGVLRASAVAVLVIVSTALLAVVAVRQARRAQAGELKARQSSYASDMLLAQRALEENDLGRVVELLERHHPKGRDVEDLRGWEWDYFNGLCRGDELFTLSGHSNRVTVLAVSPDGQTVASGGLDRTLRIWDLARREQITNFLMKGSVDAVAFSSDAAYLLAKSGAETTILKMTTTNAFVVQSIDRRLGVDRSFVSNGKFSPTGEFMAVSGGGYLRVQRTDFTKPVQEIPLSESSRLAFSPDERTLAVRSRGATLLYDLNTGSQTAVLRFGHAQVEALAFSPDGRWLASGHRDNVLQIWEVRSATSVTSLVAHASELTALSFSPDGATLATVSKDRTVKLWQTQGWQLLGTLKGHLNEVWDVAFLPDGQRLVTCGKDGTVKVWSSQPPEPPVRFKTFGPELARLGMSPDAATILRSHPNGEFSLVDTATFHESVLALAPVTNLSDASVSSGGRLLAIGSREGGIAIWNSAERRTVAKIPAIVPGRQLFSEDDKLLAVYERSGSLSVWRIPEVEKIAGFQPREQRINSLAFSPDGNLLVAGYADGVAEAWSLTTRRRVVVLAGHKESVSAVVVTPDGKTLVTASHDATAKLWDLESGRERVTLRGQLLAYFSAAISQDGRRLVLGGADGTVQLFDLASANEVARLKTDGINRIDAVGFLPGGSTLVGLSDSAKLWYWRTPSIEGTKAAEALGLK